MTLERQHPAGVIPEPLAIGTSRDGNDYVIELSGELDLGGVALVADALERALDTDALTIVFDLRRLEFLDSAGVHAILKAERLATARDRGLVIVPGPPQVQCILEIAGIVDRLVFSDR